MAMLWTSFRQLGTQIDPTFAPLIKKVKNHGIPPRPLSETKSFSMQKLISKSGPSRGHFGSTPSHPLGRTQGPPQTPKITPRAPQAPSQTLRVFSVPSGPSPRTPGTSQGSPKRDR